MPDVLTTPPPPIAAAEAEAIAREHYGIVGHAAPLPGERDRNFRLTDRAGCALFLKVINPAEDVAATRFQTGLILHLEAFDPSLPAPRLVRTLSGEPTARIGNGSRSRLTTFLPGTPLAAVDMSDPLRCEVGALLARLHGALSGYRAQAGGAILWDLARAPELGPLLQHVEDPGQRRLAASALDRFESMSAKRLEALPWQAIHNDFNPSNILVDGDGRLCGIIDFGDAILAPRIQDVAVAAAYQAAGARHPLDGLRAFLTGYGSVTSEEAEILPDLIRLRLAMTGIISAWRASLDPGNRDYTLRHTAKAWQGLARLSEPGTARDAVALVREMSRDPS